MNKTFVATTIAAVISVASANVQAAPSVEEMWETIQQQQAEIQRLKDQNKETDQKIEATADAIENVGTQSAGWAAKTTIGGYGYYNARFDGNYGYSQGLFLDYTYAADGFTATFGVTDNRRSGQAGQPDIYVGADYSGSWGRVFGTYYYDSNAAAGAYKVGYEMSLADYLPGGNEVVH